MLTWSAHLFMHHNSTPSPWLVRWQHLIPAGGSVLDVACGHGRHLRWLASRGYQVTGVDRDAVALDGLRGHGTLVHADIENLPWPLPQRQFDAVLVTNYLWRPILPHVLASVAPGGLLLYETFAQGNAAFGKPSRPDFLLAPGELLQLCQDWQVVAYECGQLPQPERVVQRIAAIRPNANAPQDRICAAPLQA